MKLLIDLPLQTMTSKVSPDAHARLKMLAKKYSARMSDVLSACLLHMSEKELARILVEQKRAVDGLPKDVKGLLRNMNKLDDEQKKLLRELLK